MPVISTRRARHSPIAAPTAIAAASSPSPSPELLWEASAMVAASAIVMPAMPNALPDLALSCRESPASDRMNSRAATMYAAEAAEASVTGASAPREHAEHPAGHGEAAEH